MGARSPSAATARYRSSVRVLVTNDDGWQSEGIKALAGAIASRGHETIVVAPTSDRSGASASVGPLHRTGAIPFEQHSWTDLPDVRVLAIDAPPATAVYASLLGGFGAVPDVVASGVNPGGNTGHLVLHSGTVGAALSAAALGVPAVAASVAWNPEGAHRFETAAALAAAALEWVMVPDDAPRVLNINAPDLPASDVLGVREASLAPYGEFWVADADTSTGDLKIEFKGHDHEPEADTDLALVRAGYVAVTPLAGIDRAGLAGAAEKIAAELSGESRRPSTSEP
jgi:5'-nucleotidase